MLVEVFELGQQPCTCRILHPCRSSLKERGRVNPLVRSGCGRFVLFPGAAVPKTGLRTGPGGSVGADRHPGRGVGALGDAQWPPTHRPELEDTAGQALEVDLTEAIVARSVGNPFFAAELLAAADRGEHALPRLLRDALLQRVGRIEATGQAVLRVAAAFDRDVPHRILAELIGVDDERLDAALRQVFEHGVLVPEQGAAAYRSRHALLAEAVYGTILPGEAERLHGRVAVALTDARDAYQVANTLAVAPLRHAVELLARLTRLDLEGLPAAAPRDKRMRSDSPPGNAKYSCS